MKTFSIFFLLLSAFTLCPVRAQTTDTLTLEVCRELALKSNKEIAASAQATENATFTAKSYKGNFFPDFSASGTGLYSTADGSFSMLGYNMDYKIGPVFSGGVSLQQPVYAGGKIDAAYKLALLGTDIARKQEILTATEVIQKTDEAYANVVKAMELRKVAEAYNTLLDELLRAVESSRQKGMKPKNDVLKVQVKLNESELSLRKAENALRLAKMNLCHYIGKPLEEDIFISSQLPEINRLANLQTYDITARPEYAILDKQIDAAREEIRLNRSELLPKIGLSASYNYVHGVEFNDRTLINKGIFTGILNVSIPIFHFGERKQKVNAAKAKLIQAELEQQDLNEKMLLELSQAANNLDEAFLEKEIAERSLSQAEENMRVSRKQYDAGMESLSDHLEAQALWQEAYARTVEAAYDLYLSYIAYKKAEGSLYVDDK